MSSAAEAELGALFINAKTAVSICQMLTEFGHPQPHTPMQTNNATAHALLTNKILPKALKAVNMRIHWLRCRNCDNILRGYLYVVTTVLSHQDGIYGFKFPNRFSEISCSCRDLTSLFKALSSLLLN
jgi:hypothetical protein